MAHGCRRSGFSIGDAAVGQWAGGNEGGVIGLASIASTASTLQDGDGRPCLGLWTVERLWARKRGVYWIAGVRGSLSCAVVSGSEAVL